MNDSQQTSNGMNKNILIIGIAIVVIAGGVWWYTGRSASYDFQFAEGESITSWDFQGAYTGNSEFEERARGEIARLKSLFGEEGYTDYELYVSIANQYGLLGDGKGEYNYLMKALAIDSEKTGLAWHNLGRLLERFGAYGSARVAYDAMVKAQPLIQYQTVRLEFLRTHVPEDTEAITAAETQLRSTTGEFIME